MRSLSLFAGVGMADRALEALGVETAAFSEVDPYAREVMRKRFPNAEDLGDIRGLDALNCPKVDVISGGFPCQDISNAGKRAGMTGARSSLWGEYARLIGELWPELVFIENVSALLGRGLDVVLGDLYQLGYACEWDCIPAAAVGAPHLRDRIWMVAYRDSREPLHVFGEERLERSLGTIEYPPSKLPRAGRMDQGALYVKDPMAPRKTKRLEQGGSTWVGAQLYVEHGWWHNVLLPTPSASSYGTNQGGAAGRVGPVRHSLDSMARNDAWPRALMPTPRADGANNAGGSNARKTAIATGDYITGQLNADWVEWLMGMPVGWTDLDYDLTVPCTWDREPASFPRVKQGQAKRKERLTCIGNALVPQVQEWVAARALERIA